MKPTRAERRAELLRQTEVLLDELLDWEEQNEQPTLTQIEDMVLKLRQRMGEQMAQSVLEAQAAQAPVPGPACPECGREMHAKSRKRKRVESRVGSLPLERTYYYCDPCRRGSFPPG